LTGSLLGEGSSVPGGGSGPKIRTGSHVN